MQSLWLDDCKPKQISFFTFPKLAAVGLPLLCLVIICLQMTRLNTRESRQTGSGSSRYGFPRVVNFRIGNVWVLLKGSGIPHDGACKGQIQWDLDLILHDQAMRS